MNTTSADALLPGGREVPFSEIEATLARLVRDGRRRKRAPARALTATVIAVGEPPRLVAAADALEQLGEIGGVRAILISGGQHTSPTARVTEHSIAISGLAPRFLNNAVAALRLSSLPALVWWRGGSVEALDDLVTLADRLVLDTEDPQEVWSHAGAFLEQTAVTDLRWTRLTRWRAMLAHVFDLPSVRAGAAGIRRLSIAAADLPSARLFAGWLRSSLGWSSQVAIDISTAAADTPAPLDRVEVAGSSMTITLMVLPSRTCLQAAVEGSDRFRRVVPLGEASLPALIGEELAVRTRDLAFERALAFAREMPQ